MDPFSGDSYLLRRKIWHLFGQAFHFYDASGRAVMYAKLKAFKLKEDMRLYTDETMTRELLHIQARDILDFGTTYDVVDSRTKEAVGALRRQALASMFGRDSWTLLDAQGREIGEVTEDSLNKALLRKYLLGALMPQTFHGYAGSSPLLTFKQHFNLFVQRMELDFSADAERKLDRRLGIAAATAIMAIEGRQNSSR